LEKVLPEHVEVLKLYLDVLPCQQTLPVYPFTGAVFIFHLSLLELRSHIITGYVLNINVTTKIHRDANDKDICLVIVISSDCEGGEIRCHYSLRVRFNKDE
jgi:hypothetical protein